MLNQDEFLERLKGLKGRTVFTLTRHRPNKIIDVTDDKVVIEGRESKVPIWGSSGIYENYKILLKEGCLEMRKKDFTGNAKDWSLYVILAIILKAFPDDFEEGGSGIIRLKK